MSYDSCTQVSLECPVEATTYGYYPNLGVNTFFTAYFGLFLAIQLFLGIKTRTWTYTIALTVGTLLELLGYIGRVLMHSNPWNNSAFEMQICCLILAPSFTAAAIYLTFKHLINHCGPEFSRIRARLYPWIFVGCDFVSIVLQAIGGGLSSAASGDANSQSLLDAGSDLMIAGISFQVATMVTAGLLVTDYFVRRQRALRRKQSTMSLEKASAELETSKNTRRNLHVFCAGVAFAYTTILIRCVYRLPEMAGGWGNSRMRDETEFLILDGMMVALATLALTLVHPGYLFPPMRATASRKICDETLPECLRCVRRQMQCSFREQTHPSFISDGPRRTSTTTRETASSTPGPAQPPDPPPSAPTPSTISDFNSSHSSSVTTQPRSFGMLELELIHHYSTQTYITITSRLQSHMIWRDVMFREAMRCDFLLDALMATSALHKSNLFSEASEDRAEYARRALTFQSAALSGYIPSLNKPTQANAIALFAISVLLPVWSFGSKRLPEGFGQANLGVSPSLTTRDSTGPSSLHDDTLDFSSVISLLQIIQGIHAVIMQTTPWLQKELIELLRSPTDEDLPPNQPDVSAALDLLGTTIEVACGKDNIGSASVQERHEIYVERLLSLRQVARCRTVLEWDLYIFAWPVTVKPLFIDLLRQRDPVALVLFVYWAVCLRSLDHLWWARGWSYRLVKDVSVLLDSSWSQCLEWPRRAMGLDYQGSSA